MCGGSGGSRGGFGVALPASSFCDHTEKEAGHTLYKAGAVPLPDGLRFGVPTGGADSPRGGTPKCRAGGPPPAAPQRGGGFPCTASILCCERAPPPDHRGSARGAKGATPRERPEGLALPRVLCFAPSRPPRPWRAALSRAFLGLRAPGATPYRERPCACVANSQKRGAFCAGCARTSGQDLHSPLGELRSAVVGGAFGLPLASLAAGASPLNRHLGRADGVRCAAASLTRPLYLAKPHRFQKPKVVSLLEVRAFFFALFFGLLLCGLSDLFFLFAALTFSGAAKEEKEVVKRTD
ncbi:hypothetical protein ES705_44003 [subsurface metagenome]